MAVAELDIPQLASFCSIPETTVHTILDQPTVELIQALLQGVSTKIHEHNELKSEKLRGEVELENAVRGGESKTRALKSSLDKAQSENTELKKRVQTEEEAKNAIQTELDDAKASSSSNTSEKSALQSRVSSLESSNRDTLSLLDSKTVAFDRLAEELSSQHQKTVGLRKQVSDLEQSVQSANAGASAAKFREQGLQQEIEQLKRNNDWLDKELKTKSEEYSKYRKEKAVRISELQRQNEDATGEIESLKKTEIGLRRRVEELGEKADGAFQKIQQMEEAIARKEESFRIELDAAARLQELTKKSATTEQQRQQDLLAELEAAKEDASEQLGRLGAELDTEHQEREACESRIAELEVQIETLQGEISALRNNSREPTTPREGLNGLGPRMSFRGGETSPLSVSPGSARMKGGLSMTQMYSNYNDIARQLDAEKRRNETLANTIDTMIQEMEAKGPEIEEIQNNHAYLQSEVETLSTLVNDISEERDQATKAIRKWENQAKMKSTEGEVLRQQLRDLSSQIKVLLMENHIRDQGHNEVSVEERARLEQIARGQIDEEAVEGQSATARFISESLVTFRDIAGLQEQNANLLKITREVGEKLENEESLRKQTEDARNWEDLQQKYERCKDEIKSLVTQSQSYIHERDMFRGMLANRGQIPRGAEPMFDESIVVDEGSSKPQQGSLMKSTEELSSSQNMADYSKLLKDMQTHFDAYKQEAATDNKTLKDQLDGISKENSRLRSEAAKSNSQVSLAHERYEMLQANFTMLKTENGELQKRSQIHSENAAKQDLRVQQVAEDLVEARGLLESMRNETANLKAEKEFWKKIEKRITEDNEALLKERNHLNSLNAKLQDLLNEREHSESETRRRLHLQIESLEKDLQSTKIKLTEVSEENRRSMQRREYDQEQNQRKIDDLISSLGSVREELIAAKTTRDHLSNRVEELTIELRSAEERLTVLKPAPTADAVANTSQQQATTTGDEDLPLSKEQELSVQLVELRRDLDLTKSALENAREQVEQYKSISQSSEDELNSLNATQDLYRQEMEKLIEEKDTRIKQLEKHIEDVSLELSSNNDELANLRNEQAGFDRRLEERQKAFEAELAQLKDQDDRHAAAAQYYQQDLKAQADIAQQAQQNYENELVKHADAAKALQKVRGDYNEIKLELVEAKTEAESAKTSLSQNEESWTDSKERLEREINELKSTRQDIKTQNDFLHKQLEVFNARKERSTPIGDEGVSEETAVPGLDSLQEVIKYLRREKEIVDVQLELSSQEAKRLKQQLDYTQGQLDETRLKLNQQRRLEAEKERNLLDHRKLMDTINDLNTLRESNVTLRAESRQAQSALNTRTQEVEALRNQIEPLQAQIRELSDKCDNYEGETKLLKENCDRWQQRAQNVLQKYDRADPAELDSLKQQLERAEAERNDIASSKKTLEEQVKTLEGQVDQLSAQVIQEKEQSNERAETIKTRLGDQFKARSKTLSERIKEKDTALQAAITERQKLEERVAELLDIQEKSNAATTESDGALQKSKAQSAPIAVMTAQSNGEEGEVHESFQEPASQTEIRELQEKVEQAQISAQQEHSEAEKLRDEAATLKFTIVGLESQINFLRQQVETLTSELTVLKAAPQESAHIPDGDAPYSDAEYQLTQVQGELTLANQELENLRDAALVHAAVATSQQEDGSKSVADQVAEHVATIRAQMEARHDERMRQNNEAFKARGKNMATQLSDKLKDGKAKFREELAVEHEKALQLLRTEHAQEIERLQARHKDELDELRRVEESKFAELKAASQQANPTEPSQADGVNVKTEAPKSFGAWVPTDEEIKLLIQNNEIVKTALRGNIAKQVSKAREDLTAQLKEEQAKTMAEAQAKNEIAKEHAVALASKKSSLQLNMATNKSKLADVKLGIVSNAAQETPQKPVSEVWALAKDVKLPTASSTTPSVANASGGQVPQSAAKASAPGTGTFGRPTPPMQPVKVNLPQTQQGLSSSEPTVERPAAPGAPTQNQNAPQNVQQTQPQESRPQPVQPGFTAPAGPAQSGQNQQANPGTGPAAQRGQTSGIPRGGSMRGNPNARAAPNQRGRGSGIARGAPQAIDTTRAAQGVAQGRGSPNSALNAGARQFVPGNKRPNDDPQGGDGKRIRGGGGPGRGGGQQ